MNIVVGREYTLNCVGWGPRDKDIKTVRVIVEDLTENYVKVKYFDDRFDSLRYAGSISKQGFYDHLIEDPLDDIRELVVSACKD